MKIAAVPLLVLLAMCEGQYTNTLASERDCALREEVLLQHDWILRQRLERAENKIQQLLEKLDRQDKEQDAISEKLDEVLKGFTEKLNQTKKDLTEKMERKLDQVSEKLNQMENNAAEQDPRNRQVDKIIRENEKMKRNATFTAFGLATKKGDVVLKTKDQPIIFNRSFFNPGNNYNRTTGMYICPFRGVFFFHFSVYVKTSPNSESAVALVRHEAVILQARFFQNGTTETNIILSNAGVLKCTQGQRVFIKTTTEDALLVNYNSLNVFAGFPLSVY